MPFSTASPANWSARSLPPYPYMWISYPFFFSHQQASLISYTNKWVPGATFFTFIALSRVHITSYCGKCISFYVAMTLLILFHSSLVWWKKIITHIQKIFYEEFYNATCIETFCFKSDLIKLRKKMKIQITFQMQKKVKITSHMMSFFLYRTLIYI
jgi:hypothetical protein